MRPRTASSRVSRAELHSASTQHPADLAPITAAVFARRSVKVAGNGVVFGAVRSLGTVTLEGQGQIQGTVEEGGTLPVPLAFPWDGRDGAGSVAPNGTYPGTLALALVREFRASGSTDFVATVVAGISSAAPPVTVDLTPPAISNRAPEGAAPTLQPTISASFSNALSGIDAVRLFLDGVDVTAQSTITGDGIAFTPGAPITSGVHNVELRVTDQAGNEAVSIWTFSFDSTPPTIVLAPASGELTLDTTPTLTATYSDAGSGVKLSSLQAKLDGTAVAFAVGPNKAEFTPAASLADGPHTLVVTLADNLGNTAQATSAFRIVASVTAIGTSGGSTAITDPARSGYGAAIVIPEGALTQSVIFTIEHIAAPAAFPSGFVPAGVVVDFNPSITFAQPATVAIPHAAPPAGFPETALKLLKFDLALQL